MKAIGRFLFSIYLWTTTVSATFLVSCLILASFLLAPFDPARRSAHRLGILWGTLLMNLNPFWRLRIVGAGRIKKDQGYVLVANHASLSDIVCLYSLGHPFKWLAKKSLFRIPFFGWSMQVMRYIPLERGRHGSIRKSYGEAVEWLRKNISVLIFPEGTRSRTGEIGHFKSGAFRLALESGRPIVPIVLAGTQGIISKGKAAFGKPGVAYMVLLSPIETKDLSVDEEDKLREKIEGLMRRELEKRNRMLARIRR